MFKNYLKIAIRNVQKHKGYAFINIAGLAIGMACCILIIIYILTELSYDKYHNNANRIYRLGLDANVGGNAIYVPISNNPTAPVLINDYPEVLNAVRIRPTSKRLVKHEDKQFYEEEIMYADNSIFDIFTFPTIKGDPKSALLRPYTTVISEDTAEKYFGTEDPIGKVLQIDSQDNFTVTGVVENVPRNSHFNFDMLFSYETLYSENRQIMEVWLNFNSYTYLLLPENYDYKELEQKFPTLIDQYMGETLKVIGGEMIFFLQPMTSIHLYSHLENEISGNGNILYVYIFSVIALFILGIACINFMNLATARSAIRAKEVGMRKVIGANRGELIKQFLGESLIYSIFSLLTALILVQIALPLFSSMSGIELKVNAAQIPWLIPGFIGLVIFVGLAAGSYPAFFLSAFRPVKVLKGSLKVGAANSRFRSILVVSQFVISISLIIGTATILKQINYMKKKSLGFDKNNVIVTRLQDQKLRHSLDSIKQQLKQIPGVISVSASSEVPGQDSNISVFVPEGFSEDQAQLMEVIIIDPDFFPTLDIGIATGRNFSDEFGTDKTGAVIINETAARKFGWDDPIGKIIKIPGDQAPDGQSVPWESRTVIGVVEDFHSSSLHKIIMPQLFGYMPDRLDTTAIRINPKNTSGTLGMIREKWKGIDPLRPLEYSFLDDSFDRQYRADERLSDIFSSFTMFAIFIACLGLFGMASFTAEQRTKEIGIRKVLGATVAGVVLLLSKNFLKLVIIANVIAWPVAYFAMKNWLKNFAYQTNINVWVFLMTGALALTVSLLTVSFQSIRAALTNPADAIKYE